MISLEEVTRISSEFNVVPLTKTLFSGTETPVGIYNKLCEERPNTFLLESAEAGVWGRYSFIGVNIRGELSFDGAVSWKSNAPATPAGSLNSDPLLALRQFQQSWRSSPTEHPLSSGMVGFISWGLTELLEKMPERKLEPYKLPLYTFLQFSELVIVDHLRSELVLISLIFLDGHEDIATKYANATKNLHDLEDSLRRATPVFLRESSDAKAQFNSNISKSDFLSSVERAKEYVRKGDVFQVVVSQRFDQEYSGDPLDIYRCLRAANPSPYMYLLRMHDADGDFSVVGSSPEALIKVRGDRVITHPIAGSRPRGLDPLEDAQMEKDLLGDEKERSEHLMLVDLARNDLLRVCKPESLRVSEFMQVNRFSHIMHLSSTVEGELKDGSTPVDALLSTFPAGTLSGAPKPRALEIISELEHSYRGLFGGVVGYFDFAGNADLAIAIRTAIVRDGVAHVQAGAGIVLDSQAEAEYQETLKKAEVVLKSVGRANAMRDE
jgi:anthranilate synthase component 1